MSLTILIADPIDNKAQQMLVDAGFDVTAPGEPTQDEIIKLIPEYEVLMVRSRTKVTKEMIEAGVKLKVIGRAGVGMDTIDVAAADARGIQVMNAPGSNSRSVAEHAIGLMFALARMIPQANASMKAGQWEKKSFKGFELAGKTLGILGFGNVGRIVAEMARGIGMQVCVWSAPTPSSSSNNEYMICPDLHALLARADFVSIHVPKVNETEGLISRDAFAAMREGAYLINTARGGIVDEDALVAALEHGTLAGAALDVYDHEPVPDQILVKHPRVIATPHIAASTKEAQIRAGVMVVEKIIEWARIASPSSL